MKHIVIIGGGFAGINLVKDLSNQNHYRVTLVDKNNYNFFPPLLYQVATGLLNVSSISVPFRSLLKEKKQLNFRIGELIEIKPSENKVMLSTGELGYDYLVLATGTTSNFFGMENIEQQSLPMKTVEEAIQLRNALLTVAEMSTITKNATEQEKFRNIVIAGAGAAGVEIAGMLAELRNRSLTKIYPELNKDLLNIILVEGNDSVLSNMSEKSQKYTLKSLKKLGIDVRLNAFVTDYKDDIVSLKDGETIPTKTLIWTTGVKAYRFSSLPDQYFDKSNRIKVDAFNQIEGTKNLFAIGDTCIQTHDERYPKGHPQLGSIATQQGKQLAANFIAMANNKKLKPFYYKDKGTMAIIGKSKATADLTFPEKTYTGWFAWATWLLVHLFLLINYRNRIVTMFDWTISYFLNTEPNALLLGKTKKQITSKKILHEN